MPRVSKEVKALTTRTAEAKLAKEKMHIQKMALELAKMRGELVLISDMRRYVTTCNSMVKARLLSLPEKVAPRVIGVPVHRAAAIIRQLLEEALEELAYDGERSVPEPDGRAAVDARLNRVLEQLTPTQEDNSE